VVDDVHAVDGASHIPGIEHRTGNEIDIEARQRFRQVPGFENANPMPFFEEPTNEDVAESAAASGYER
jgi:hypothetical protein